MKALKGLLIYIGLILGIFVGMSLILLCIMYFVPSFRILGVGVVHYSKNINEESIVIEDYEPYDKIELSVFSNKVNINIVPSEQETITYSMKLSVFGLSTEIVEYKVIKRVEVEDGTLKVFITVSEPNGWISNSSSVVSIGVPEKLFYSIITNSQSGNVSIGGDKMMGITNLSVSTTKGNLTLKNIATDGNDLWNLDGLSLSTESGSFDFSDMENIYVANKVKLVASRGTFTFKNINASFNITGTDVKFFADNVIVKDEGFATIANNATIKCKKLESPVGVENTIITENLDIDIETISGKTGIVTTHGDIDIKTLDSYTVIEDTNGNVHVNLAKDTLIITTDMGNISVDSYLKTGKFTSRKGNITVRSDSDYVDGYYTKIYNFDGNVNVINRINRLIINTDGRSKVDVQFLFVKENFESEDKVFHHQINTSMLGDCTVTFYTLYIVPFEFTAKGKVSGEISGLYLDEKTYKVEASESSQYYPSVESKDKTELNAKFDFYGNVTFKSSPNEIRY